MAERELAITTVTRTLDDDLVVGDPLLFSEINCCETKIERLRALVKGLAKKAADASPNFKLHQRMLPGDATLDTAKITLAPPKKNAEWTEPVELTFNVVSWRHGGDAYIAFVPELGIEIVASREADLQRMIPDHITAALRRTKIAESLYALALTQRGGRIVLDRSAISVSVKSPRHIEQEEGKEKQQKPVIEDVGEVLPPAAAGRAFAMEAVVGQIADALTAASPRSVLLVGPSGVGKTAAVMEMIRRAAELKLAATPFWQTSGSRLIAGMSGFGMWQKRCQRLVKEATRDRAVVLFGNLVELMEVGRHGGGQGIAGFLRPHLARGEMLAIVECTAEQLPLIERENPHLLDIFQQIKVEEPSPAAGSKILLDKFRISGPAGINYASGWLDTLDRLHRRYATYSAYPGRPLRFMDNLLKDHPAGVPLDPARVISVFSRETGLPRFMLDPEAPLDLSAERRFFADRVIGQEHAIDRVIDLLATVKAALTRPRRPIASLLFIGPTGVGKTELAKALAEYFFGDRNRLTRFDMSEFAGPTAVERLAGGAFGTEGVLTAKVREQPFSVILFDEFEKAHWSFFDLLLGILGEGRLTDAAGRLGDFSNAIVVMTSNLGAEAFGKGTFGLGRGDGQADPITHFTDEVREFVRPELFNRIDRIIPFLPLDSGAIRRITDREISSLEKRDGIRLRGVRLELTGDARQYLSDRGYDVRYGARPLKRAIERELLAPLAASVNTYPADMKIHAAAHPKEGRLDVVVRAEVDEFGRTASVASSGSELAVLALACCAFRRDVQRLDRCTPFLAVVNQLFLLERAVRRKPKAKAARSAKAAALEAQRQEQIRELKEITNPAAALTASIIALEDEILSALYGDAAANRHALHRRLAPLRVELGEILLALLARQTPKPHGVTVAIFGDRLQLWELARAYHTVALANGCSARLFWFSRYGKEHLHRNPCGNVGKFLEAPDAKAIGVAIGFSGRHVALRFTAEAGIHQFTSDGDEMLCMVDTSADLVNEYQPPEGVEFPKDPDGKARREYKLDDNVAIDATLKQRLNWSGKDISVGIADAMDIALQRAIAGVLIQ